jgi:threonyl-tRNA synthetase
MSEQKDLNVLRHSAAHLMAHAIKQLYPQTLLTLGPATEDGFFYDMLPITNFKEEDLPRIEERMRELAKNNLSITHREISKAEAQKLFAGNQFKEELIRNIPDETVGLSEQGDFYDLCKGGHVKSTGEIRYFKLMGISGAYWRADRNGTALQRISGVVFHTQKDLDTYLQRLEDLKQYDHRKLGKQLGLFSFHEEGPGLPFFLPKGKIVFNILENYMRLLLSKYNYDEVSTPTILNEDLWKQSGHYYNYKENMYFTEPIEGKQFAIKPMNCPGGILIYKERPHSYRELPIKMGEFGKVHRHELSGVLNGLFRVRAFTQDDAHIFCTKDQLEEQVIECITIVREILSTFGLTTTRVCLSTRPKKSMGTDEMWNDAEEGLKGALNASGLKYEVLAGDGAFYGPKIDFRFNDAMGREWQCGTIQVDFNNPENFDMTYINFEGKKERPVMIHRAILGSFERFFGILLEHYKGNLPFWLVPVQARVMTITDKQLEYGQQVLTTLKKAGIRAELDNSGDQISAKIKTAQLEKIPWMIVLGPKEQEQGTITIRNRDGSQEQNIALDLAIEKALKLNTY